jgi:hypothetical protein
MLTSERVLRPRDKFISGSTSVNTATAIRLSKRKKQELDVFVEYADSPSKPDLVQVFEEVNVIHGIPCHIHNRRTPLTLAFLCSTPHRPETKTFYRVPYRPCKTAHLDHHKYCLVHSKENIQPQITRFRCTTCPLLLLH